MLKKFILKLFRINSVFNEHSSFCDRDLDGILARSHYFKFGGYTHEIKPVTLDKFIRFTSEFQNMQSKKTHDMDLYTKCFRIVCPSITHKHVEQMSVIQLGALFDLIFEIIQGKQIDSDQKKN